MSSVIASHIPTTVSVDKLRDFFGFCGSIKAIHLLDKSDKLQKYEVVFELPKALSTALLLNDAELDSVAIKVEDASATPARKSVSGAPPSYSSVSGSVAGAGDHKVQNDAILTGDSQYDDISQEEKPKSAILAQLLASGYSISDQVIERSIKIDKEQGYSAKFQGFLADLDKKYIHSSEPNSLANTTINKALGTISSLASSFDKSSYKQKLQHYFEQASNSEYGLKIHEFYKNLTKEITDVHNEAKRLNELKKEKKVEESASTANAAAAINTVN